MSAAPTDDGLCERCGDLNNGSTFSPYCSEECSIAFYVVGQDDPAVPDEHYCADHLISEADYCAKHGLPTSESVCVEPNDGDGACDVPGCPNVAAQAEEAPA